ncbi:WD40 repeat domain-containing protein [Kamptonema formosum]|uniref:WD40 repeat domain-containing protein n=1 Tax=Kamptonema formosum TaxID=331992 RepID=UPI00034D2804|nr:WD40 repeat domain-containing protein [Oscillatoria sp. PCC 10802]
MLKNRSWLEIAEYLSIAGSVLGSAVAVTSQQLIYATTPVSLALLLNLVNRRRLELLPGPSVSTEMARTHRQLSAEVESLRLQLLALPASPEVASIREALGHLSETVAGLQAEVTAQTLQIASVGDRIQMRENPAPPALKLLPAQLDEINRRLNSLPVAAQPAPEPLVEELRAVLARVTEGIAHLNRNGENLVTREDLARLISEIDKQRLQLGALGQSVAPVEGTLARLSQRIASVSGQQEGFSEQFNRRLDSLQASSPQQLEELKGAIAKIQQRLDRPIGPQPADLSDVEAAIGKLSEKLAAVRSEMQSRFASLERPHLASISEALATLQVQLGSLQESASRLAGSASAGAAGAPRETPPQSRNSPGEAEKRTEKISPPERKEQTAEKRRQPIMVEPVVPSKFARKSFRCVRTQTGHGSAVTCLAISSDGKLLASGSYKNIKLWDLETGELLHTLAMHSDAMAVSSIAISPDGETLACANADIEIWSLRTRQQIRTLETACWASAVAISPDGKILVSGGEDPVDETGSIEIWDLQKGEILHDLYPDVIYAVAISADGKILASAGSKATAESTENKEEAGLVQVRRLETRELLHALVETSGKVSSVAVSPDGQVLASGCQDGSVKLWDLKTGQVQRILLGHSLPVNCVAISADGNVLASGSSDRTVKLWNPHTGELLQTLEEHAERVSAVAFSPDGKTLVSGSQDETVKICRWE